MLFEEMDRVIRHKFRVGTGGSLPFKSYNGSRETLGELMNEFGYKIGAEIGVWRGAYSRSLCGSIPNLTIKCVDPWTPFTRHSQARMDQYYERTRHKLRHFNAEFIRKPSMEAVKEVPDGSLDFVYIDEMHEFDPCMCDLIFWSPKVRIGGMVAGHDYDKFFHLNGVIEAANVYTQAHNISPWYITADEHPSFFWIKRK